MQKIEPQCAMCKQTKRICLYEDGKGPKFCPTISQEEVVQGANNKYLGAPAVLEFARMASVQEGECYANRNARPLVLHPTKPRVQEVCEFARKMGFKKIGVAFCGGLFHEAEIFVNILEREGFEVVSVCCKVGGTPKEFIGIKEEEKICIGSFESMCNPIAQAEVLNNAQTDFNVLVGLCVGHDSLFLKYCKAWTTVLVVKDRVTGHNPAAALYTSQTYYSRLLGKTVEEMLRALHAAPTTQL